jgi:hypothetical protein
VPGLRVVPVPVVSLVPVAVPLGSLELPVSFVALSLLLLGFSVFFDLALPPPALPEPPSPVFPAPVPEPVLPVPVPVLPVPSPVPVLPVLVGG